MSKKLTENDLHKRKYLTGKPGKQYYVIWYKGKARRLSHLIWNLHNPDDRVKQGEVVHHRNGNRADNRIENLILLPSMPKHLPSMRIQKIVKELNTLKQRIMELEIENALLKKEKSVTSP